MSDIDWTKYGNAISDNDGELRDISAIIAELEEIQLNFSATAMNDRVLFLRGRADMLCDIIQYLRKV